MFCVKKGILKRGGTKKRKTLFGDQYQSKMRSSIIIIIKIIANLYDATITKLIRFVLLT